MQSRPYAERPDQCDFLIEVNNATQQIPDNEFQMLSAIADILASPVESDRAMVANLKTMLLDRLPDQYEDCTLTINLAPTEGSEDESRTIEVSFGGLENPNHDNLFQDCIWPAFMTFCRSQAADALADVATEDAPGARHNGLPLTSIERSSITYHVRGSGPFTSV